MSPSMVLFGQRMKLYGELYANGEAVTHPEGTDASTTLGRRLQMRQAAKIAAEKYQAKEMIRKSTAENERTFSM